LKKLRQSGRRPLFPSLSNKELFSKVWTHCERNENGPPPLSWDRVSRSAFTLLRATSRMRFFPRPHNLRRSTYFWPRNGLRLTPPPREDRVHRFQKQSYSFFPRRSLVFTGPFFSECPFSPRLRFFFQLRPPGQMNPPLNFRKNHFPPHQGFFFLAVRQTGFLCPLRSTTSILFLRCCC